MKVLLTGAAGFIGSAVRGELSARGHEVVGLDALIPQAHPVEVDAPGLVHRVDVRDAAAVGPLLAGVDVVCHQAAMVGAGTTVADLPLYAGHNDLGTAVLLAAMGEHSVQRLVLASSMVVYGEGRYTCSDHGDVSAPAREVADLEAGDFEAHCPDCRSPLEWALVDESARLDPRSSYAASKVAQEHYASAWARQAAGRVVALRYHNAYGPGMPRDTPYSGVAAMFRSSLERGEAPVVYEDGAQMRDFVHVSDVARANAVAVEAVGTQPPGRLEPYNVCSGSPIAISDVARLISRGSPNAAEPVVTGAFRAGDVRHVVASGRRAATELGFSAEVRPEDGLADFATAPLRA